MIASHQISDLRFDKNQLVLIVDEKVIKIDLAKISLKLLNASEVERSIFKVSPSGYGIHWPLIDEDISVNELLK
jgi:hypothetical protein